jgi:hypothetical protein
MVSSEWELRRARGNRWLAGRFAGAGGTSTGCVVLLFPVERVERLIGRGGREDARPFAADGPQRGPGLGVEGQLPNAECWYGKFPHRRASLPSLTCRALPRPGQNRPSHVDLSGRSATSSRRARRPRQRRPCQIIGDKARYERAVGGCRQLLVTSAGVGPRVAAAVVAHLPALHGRRDADPAMWSERYLDTMLVTTVRRWPGARPAGAGDLGTARRAGRSWRRRQTVDTASNGPPI